MPGDLNDRAADNWTPLLILADLAGGDWPARARQAALALSGGDDGEALGLNGQLLADIRELFKTSGSNVLSSKDITDRLAQIEGRPWAEYGKHRRPISSNQLANLLRGFRVSSRTVRIGDKTPRGYDLVDFAEAFSRYLPNSGIPKCNNATSLDTIGESRGFQGETLKACCTPENMVPANDDWACCIVALQNGENVPATEKEPALDL